MNPTSYAPEGVVELLSSDIGLVILFAIFVLEGAMLLYFIPSELVVPLSLFLIGDAPGQIALVLGIAVSGATLGQLILFVVAGRKGKQYLTSKSWFPASASQVDKYEQWFQQWGRWAVPTTNSLLFVRGTATIPAGFSKMELRQFVALSAIGTTVFQSAMAALYIYGITIII